MHRCNIMETREIDAILNMGTSDPRGILIMGTNRLPAAAPAGAARA